MEEQGPNTTFQHETQRLAVVHRYLLLKELPEIVFQELVHLTAVAFARPICFLSLVEEKQVWFLTCFGVDGIEYLPLDQTLCPISIRQATSTVFSDLRTATGLQVDFSLMELLGIRFYAGAPLVSRSGFRVGALCLADCQPAQVTELDLQLLQQLADLAIALMDLHYATATTANPSDNTLAEHVEETISWMRRLANMSHYQPEQATIHKQALGQEARTLARTIRRSTPGC